MVGVKFTLEHPSGQDVQSPIAMQVADPFAQCGDRDRLDLVAHPTAPTAIELARPGQPGLVLLQSLDQLVHALTANRDGPHYGWPPVARPPPRAKREHVS